MLAMLTLVAGPALTILAVALLLMLIAELACRWQDARSVRWEAIVDWEGDQYTHPETTQHGAIQWAACYPADAAVRVYRVMHGHRTMTAARWAS